MSLLVDSAEEDMSRLESVRSRLLPQKTGTRGVRTLASLVLGKTEGKG